MLSYGSGMRPLPQPFDRIARGQPAEISVSGSVLLGSRLLTKDLAFPPHERLSFGLNGLLPDRVMTIEDQLVLELEHLRRKHDDLEQYIGLAALQDRNATLFYRLLAEHTEEFLPIVYTPTVGRACQEFSHIVRRTRGVWITPADRDRIPEVLGAAPFEDVRLIVATDNERILGLGDLGAGGMGIPIGKLALYTAACGIFPALTLPVSIDVGTDNPALLEDPLYIGYRAPRLRGPAYDELLDAFVEGVQRLWPGCLIQWEDLKQYNAVRVMERYRDRVPSFNDDIQGTAAVVVAGLLAAIRRQGSDWRRQRILIVGAGAAGVGSARLIARAMAAAGLTPEETLAAIALVDSRGLVHAGRTDLDELKRPWAMPSSAVAALGPAIETGDLRTLVGTFRPTALVGLTGMPGIFSEAVVRTLASVTPEPTILALSNPTWLSEGVPAEMLAWSGGAALVATGSPFPPVPVGGELREIAQANNVFIFPGVGLGAIVAEASVVTDEMFLAAAEELAGAVDAGRLAAGQLYPRVSELRTVARRIALAVAREAVRCGVSRIAPDEDVEAAVDAAMWWPEYVPYRPAAPRIEAAEAAVVG
jgi:malic enzyme